MQLRFPPIPDALAIPVVVVWTVVLPLLVFNLPHTPSRDVLFGIDVGGFVLVGLVVLIDHLLRRRISGRPWRRPGVD